MARNLRLEYEGATYHIISRGNYRADVFGRDTMKTAFLKRLAEAFEESGWIVHAWCVRSNHYHLCFTYPQPNSWRACRYEPASGPGGITFEPVFRRPQSYEIRRAI